MTAPDWAERARELERDLFGAGQQADWHGYRHGKTCEMCDKIAAALAAAYHERDAEVADLKEAFHLQGENYRREVVAARQEGREEGLEEAATLAEPKDGQAYSREEHTIRTVLTLGIRALAASGKEKEVKRSHSASYDEKEAARLLNEQFLAEVERRAGAEVDWMKTNLEIFRSGSSKEIAAALIAKWLDAILGGRE